MTTLRSIRKDFAAREDSLDVFELFSGTGSPGRKGTPDMPAPGEPDPGLSVSDSLAIGTFTSLGLTGISYGLMRYSRTNPVETVLEPMKLLYEKIQLGKALEAAQQGKDVTKLMEILPYVGTPVKRMNIDKIWEEVADVLKIMQLNVDRARLAIEPVDHSMDTLQTVSKAAFVGFGTLSALGATATTITATFHDRAMPLVEDVESETSGLNGRSGRMADKVFDEFAFRSDKAMDGLDSKLAEIDRFAGTLPDVQDMVKLVAEAEALFAPITRLSADISGLVKPYEDFLDVAQLIGAPIEGVLQLFEHPPKVLPAIVGQDTITPGFWLGPVWVPPVTVPVWGFKELFDPIPRDEVQKIIDLVVKIAGIPQQLLETALSPILKPLQAQIDKVMKPIVDKLNPFDDYLDDFDLAKDTFAALKTRLNAVQSEIEEALSRLDSIRPDLSPIEEIGKLDPKGVATFFGSDAGEKIIGMLPEKSGGFLDGSMLQGNGGKDAIFGTRKADFLGGGAGRDSIRADDGADFVMGGSGNDFLDGGRANDVMMGGNGKDNMRGGGGKDEMFGGNSNDRIAGGGGRDRMFGEKGRDVLDGDRGMDIMTGGKDADRFVFNAIGETSKKMKKSDIIKDFEADKDHVVLRAIDASRHDRGNDRFHFNGEERGFGRDPDGEIYFRHIDKAGHRNDVTVVYLDTDRDARHEAIIRMHGLIDLDAGDFVL